MNRRGFLAYIIFYVATNGNDTWSGKQATPNTTKTDGSFTRIAQSRDAIRQLKQQQGVLSNNPLLLWYRSGTYFLRKPLLFTPEDSGTPTAPITYTANECL